MEPFSSCLYFGMATWVLMSVFVGKKNWHRYISNVCSLTAKRFRWVRNTCARRYTATRHLQNRLKWSPFGGFLIFGWSFSFFIAVFVTNGHVRTPMFAAYKLSNSHGSKTYSAGGRRPSENMIIVQNHPISPICNFLVHFFEQPENKILKMTKMDKSKDWKYNLSNKF